MARHALRIEVAGDEQLLAAFHELERLDQGKVLRKAMREAMKPLLADIRASAPRRRGILAKNIKLKAGRRSRTKVSVVIVTGTAEQLGIKAGKMVPRTEVSLVRGRGVNSRNRRRGVRSHKRSRGPGYYPAHVELGTRKMAAQPYMRPALARHRERVVSDLASSLWRHIGLVVEKRRKESEAAAKAMEAQLLMEATT